MKVTQPLHNFLTSCLHDHSDALDGRQTQRGNIGRQQSRKMSTFTSVIAASPFSRRNLSLIFNSCLLPRAPKHTHKHKHSRCSLSDRCCIFFFFFCAHTNTQTTETHFPTNLKIIVTQCSFAETENFFIQIY